MKLLHSYGPGSYKQVSFGGNRTLPTPALHSILPAEGGLIVSLLGAPFQLLRIFLQARCFQSKSFQPDFPEDLLPPCQLLPMGAAMPASSALGQT